MAEYTTLVAIIHALLWGGMLLFFVSKLRALKRLVSSFDARVFSRFRTARRMLNLIEWSLIASYAAIVVSHFVEQSTVGMDLVAAVFIGMGILFFFKNREDLEYAVRRVVGREMPIPVAQMRMEAPIREIQVGQFWWYLNGESTIVWDREAAVMHEIDPSDFGPDDIQDDGLYAVAYERWSQTVDGEQELHRLQALAAESFAAGDVIEMISRHRAKDGSQYYVTTKGNVKEMGDGRLMAYGLLIRTEVDGKTHEETRDIASQIESRLRSLDGRKMRVYKQIIEK